jgi:hypothetical protein
MTRPNVVVIHQGDHSDVGATLLAILLISIVLGTLSFGMGTISGFYICQEHGINSQVCINYCTLADPCNVNNLPAAQPQRTLDAAPMGAPAK